MVENSRPGTPEPFAGLLLAAAAKALSADAAALWRLNETGSGLVCIASHGLLPPPAPPGAQDSAASPSSYVTPPTASLLHQNALAGGSASVEDAESDPRGAELPAGFLAALCVPLGGATGPSRPRAETSLGTQCVYYVRPRSFTDSEISLLRTFADLAAASFGPTPITPSVEPHTAGQDVGEAERSRLARVTTHQLRSPITIAQSLLRNLLKGYAGPITDQQRDVLDRIANQLDYLSHLVNDFLELAASKAPPVAGQEGAVVLNLSVARAVLVLQPRAEEKGIALVLRPCREELVVWASEEGLDHVFHNLVENAVKYTPSGGEVTVSLARGGEESGADGMSGAGEAQVTVTDTGIGIPDEAQEHLFEEFYRAPNARACNAVGTGLGLAIVKGLVDRYHGRITMRSASGQGTTFTVSIPLHGAASAGPV
jgi:signal transduction histidine kinase